MKSLRGNRHPALDFVKARERMVREQIIGRGIEDRKVIDALTRIPRANR